MLLLHLWLLLHYRLVLWEQLCFFLLLQSGLLSLQLFLLLLLEDGLLLSLQSRLFGFTCCSWNVCKAAEENRGAANEAIRRRTISTLRDFQHLQRAIHLCVFFVH
jgi:hypothetical protein